MRWWLPFVDAMVYGLRIVYVVVIVFIWVGYSCVLIFALFTVYCDVSVFVLSLAAICFCCWRCCLFLLLAVMVFSFVGFGCLVIMLTLV